MGETGLMGRGMWIAIGRLDRGLVLLLLRGRWMSRNLGVGLTIVVGAAEGLAQLTYWSPPREEWEGIECCYMV